MKEGLHSRYPGIRAFEKEEGYLFFGRRLEIKRLLAQVKAKPLVVLFSKSGIGKSSLINAGLVPMLNEGSYQSIKVRLQDTGISPVNALKLQLEPYLDEGKLYKHTGKNKHNAGLWEFFRACRFERDEEPLVPVIIFDQFEEFFEHGMEEQELLIIELADLLSERLPGRIQESLRAIKFTARTPEDLEWHSPINVKVVFAIRSDQISLLDTLSGEIPSILDNRFHLKPLQKDQARNAIVRPAALKGEHFVTPPFEYEKDTLELILNKLSNKQGEIESFQLQLICQHIERKVKEKYG